MKTTVTVKISFEAGQAQEKAEEILGLVGCTQEEVYATEGFHLFDPTTNEMHPGLLVYVTFNEGDERIPKLCELLAVHGIQADVETTKSVEYSEEDYQIAPLLKMSAGNEWLTSRPSELGTKYDLKNACPHCGTGAKQIWYQRVKRKELPTIRKHRALMGGRHIIVDARIRKMLVNAGITGISFAEVHARDEVGFWNAIDREQILIEHTLPPMRGELTADDEQNLCKVCRRGGRVSFPNKPYTKEDLVGMKDFNLTWEWFGSFSFDGNVRNADFSLPRILVTPKVMDVFRAAEVKSFKWTPVDIEA